MKTKIKNYLDPIRRSHSLPIMKEIFGMNKHLIFIHFNSVPFSSFESFIYSINSIYTEKLNLAGLPNLIGQTGDGAGEESICLRRQQEEKLLTEMQKHFRGSVLEKAFHNHEKKNRKLLSLRLYLQTWFAMTTITYTGPSANHGPMSCNSAMHCR